MKWFFATVSSAMSGQIRGLGEGLVTFITSVGPFARMGPHVGFQSAWTSVPVKKGKLWFTISMRLNFPSNM